jgi:hypothetical protein
MGQANIELGKSIEKAAKDYVGRSNCRIEGISQKVVQIVARQSLSPNDVKRM